jgi:hypothetical protein
MRLIRCTRFDETLALNSQNSSIIVHCINASPHQRRKDSHLTNSQNMLEKTPTGRMQVNIETVDKPADG